MPSFLLNLNFHLIGEEFSSLRYIVQDIYVLICDIAFRSDFNNEAIQESSTQAIAYLYDKYLNHTINNADQFQGCGPCYKALFFIFQFLDSKATHSKSSPKNCRESGKNNGKWIKNNKPHLLFSKNFGYFTIIGLHESLLYDFEVYSFVT